MQRLILAALFLAIIVGIVGTFSLGLRASVREGSALPTRPEGSNMQKLAFAALILLIAGVSTGLLGGL